MRLLGMNRVSATRKSAVFGLEDIIPPNAKIDRRTV